MKPWLALALLVAPFAGCVQPAPDAAPVPAVGPASAPLPTAGALRLAAAWADDENATSDCPTSPERTEQAVRHEVVIRVRGCLALNQPDLGLRGPDEPEARVEVLEGASHLRVQVHLLGKEAFHAILEGPDHARQRASAVGDRDRDSFLAFEAPSPPPGRWSLRARVDDLAVARSWTIVAVIAYGTDPAASPS